MPENSRSSAIRAQFPALERAHNGESVAYFDGPGGTQVPRSVVEAMSDYLYHHNANTHWSFPTSAETDRLIAESRRACADFLNANPGEIVFGANMTSLAFHLSRSLGQRFGPGDEIVVTELDHHANIDPWRRLARERGVAIRTARVLPEIGELDWDHFESLLNENTRLVAIGAASNALGTMSDVRRGVELARQFGALSFIDAVHFAPHRLIDVAEWRCDFLACSAYKFHGPHIGVLYGRRRLLDELDVPKLEPAPNAAPERLETGTQNHEGIAGAGAAVDFIASLGSGPSRRGRIDSAFREIHERESALFRSVWEGLGSIAGVRLYGPSPERPRTPTVAFTVAGHSSESVATHLAARAVFVSHGDFYASTVVKRLGLSEDGLVRAGLALYSTNDEVERLIEGVREIACGRVMVGSPGQSP